jgi:hypothetical protein
MVLSLNLSTTVYESRSGLPAIQPLSGIEPSGRVLIIIGISNDLTYEDWIDISCTLFFITLTILQTPWSYMKESLYHSLTHREGKIILLYAGNKKLRYIRFIGE